MKNCFSYSERSEKIEIVELVENTELLEKIIKNYFSESKSLLNDFESNSEISEFSEKYNENKENNYSFVGVKKIDKEFLLSFEYISEKKYYFTFLNEIENILLYVCSVLSKKISYKKHLKVISEISELIESDFVYDIYYNRFEYLSENKYLMKNISELQYNIKNIYKILKYSYTKMLKQIINIIENHEIEFNHDEKIRFSVFNRNMIYKY